MIGNILLVIIVGLFVPVLGHMLILFFLVGYAYKALVAFCAWIDPPEEE